MSTGLYDEALNPPALEPEPVEEEEKVDDQTFGLIYNGQLSEVVKVAGHDIRIRTLRIGEELEASLLANKWSDTGEAGRALATALVAACIVSVDGKPLLEGLGPHESTMESKFDYIRSNWYWVTIRTIYQEYDGLLRTVLEKHEQMLKG